MRTMVCLLSGLLVFGLCVATNGFSAPDQYMGDASIYQGIAPAAGGGRESVSATRR